MLLLHGHVLGNGPWRFSFLSLVDKRDSSNRLHHLCILPFSRQWPRYSS